MEHTARRRAWIEVDLQAVRRNTAETQKWLPEGCALMAVAKADAYGHGALPLAREWNRCGVETLCVASLDEAVELREGGVGGDILVLGYTHPGDAELLCHYDLIQTLVDAEHGEALAGSGFPLRAHIKIDTGMNRLGVPSGETGAVLGLLEAPGLQVEGIFTHFFAADDPGPEAVAATRGQIARFATLLKKLRAAGHTHLKTHMQSSYGIFNYPGIHCHWARAGLALYGGMEGERLLHKKHPRLRPALAIKVRVEHVARVKAGQGVGYGPAFTAGRESEIATLSIGYGDGIPRNLSEGGGRVLLDGRYAPIVGRICMDRLHIDVTGLNVRQGDVAVLLGSSGEGEITVAEMARRAGTIPNEIFSRLGPRLGRFYQNGPEPGHTGELPRRVPQYTR